MSDRPFLSSSIDALEKLFDEARGSRSTLQTIGAELLLRNNKRAFDLLARVQQAIAVLPQNADDAEPGIWGQLSRRLMNDERLLIQRSPLTVPPSTTQQLALWPMALELARYDAHMGIPRLRGMLHQTDIHHNYDAYGHALKLGAFELRNGTVRSWPGFALLMRKMLGDNIIPWLPSLFLAAVALPDIEPPDFDLDEVLTFRNHL